MRIRLAIPDHLVTAPALEAALEATMLANQAAMARGEVPALTDAIAGGVRWKPEPFLDGEHFDLAHQVAARGWGDCDDLAPWLAAELRASGEDEGARPRVVRTGSKRWHVVVQTSDGKILDPSKWAGMGKHTVSGVAGIVAKPMAAPGRGALCVVPHKGEYWARCDVPWAGSVGHLASHAKARTADEALNAAVAGAIVCGEAIGSPDLDAARMLACGLLGPAGAWDESICGGFVVGGKLARIDEELTATLSFLDEVLHKRIVPATFRQPIDKRVRDAWWHSIGSDARQRRRADWSWIHDRDPVAADAGNWYPAQYFWWNNLSKDQRQARRAYYVESHSVIKSLTAPLADLGRELKKTPLLNTIVQTVVPVLSAATTVARIAHGDKLSVSDLKNGLGGGPIAVALGERFVDTYVPGSSKAADKGWAALSAATKGEKVKLDDVAMSALGAAVEKYAPEIEKYAPDMKAKISAALDTLHVKLPEHLGKLPGLPGGGLDVTPQGSRSLLTQLSQGKGLAAARGAIPTAGGVAVPLAVQSIVDDANKTHAPLLYYHPHGAPGPVVMRW